MKRLDVLWKAVALLSLVASATPALASDRVTAKHEIAASANQAAPDGALGDARSTAGQGMSCGCERRRAAQEAADHRAMAERWATRRDTWKSRNE